MDAGQPPTLIVIVLLLIITMILLSANWSDLSDTAAIYNYMRDSLFISPTSAATQY